MKSTANKHQTIPLTLLFLFLSPEILILIGGAQAEFGEESTPSRNQYSNSYQSFSPFLAILIAGFITSLFFVVLYIIFVRYNSGDSSSVSPTVPHPATAVVSRGLDRLVIETFPTFLYSEVKDHQIGKAENGILECAVCLNEFEDDETLRLIPKCDHVFHPECIDAWLELHVTCPVCRADLVPQPGDDLQPVLIPVDKNEEDVNDQVVIQIDDENQPQNRRMKMDRNLSFQYPKSKQQGKEMNRNFSFHYSKRPQRSWSFQKSRMFDLGKFRSSSTGELLVQPGEDLNRFTLRLPDVMRKEVIDRASLNRTSSFATIIEDGCEIEKKSESEVKSERWNFFARALSMKLRSPREVAESSGSTSKGGGNRTPVRMVSFKCLEPRADDDDDSRVRLRPDGPFKAE